MGEQHRRDLCYVDAALCKPRLLLLERKSEIDENKRITRTDGNRIAARTAS
jgi:hypothetical protein